MQFDLPKILDAILYDGALEDFSNYAKAHLDYDVDVYKRLHEDRCYTCVKDSNRIEIVLGLNFYEKAYKVPKTVDEETFNLIFDHASLAYTGLIHHEILHGKHTPMQYRSRLLSRLTSSLEEFAGNITNVLEDMVIEFKGTRDEPKLKEPFRVMNEFMTYQETIDALDEQIKNNPKNPATMVNFLLNKVYENDYLLHEKYSLYEDNKDFFDDCLYIIQHTPDNNLRLEREIAFAIEISKLLDGEQPDKNNVDKPGQVPSGRPGPQSYSGGDSSNTSILQNTIKVFNSKNGSDSLWSTQLLDGKEELDTKPPTSSTKAVNDTSCSETPMLGGDLSQEQITMLANDEPVLDARHRVVHLNNYINTSGYISHYNKALNTITTLINSTVHVIKRLKSSNVTTWKYSQKSGKFHIKSYIKPSLKDRGEVFKKSIAPKKELDSVWALVLDASGSTLGFKSYMEGLAAMCLGESLNRLRYPFAIYSFTEGSECYTIKLKDFKDSFLKTKTNLTVHTEQYRVDGLPLFCCNVDEVTLKHVRRALMKQPQKDKICVIISDGATCGSKDDLKKMAQSMQRQGISVLAIGVYDDNVKDIYDNYIIIKNEADLKKLPKFLSDYLISKVFKEV